MKKLLLFFLFLSANLLAQQADLINGIPANYTIFNSGEINYVNTLFDSSTVAASGRKKVSIEINDSLSRISGRNKYSEQLSFEFEKSGKIKSGNYSLTHPQIKTQQEYICQYFGNNEVFLSNGGVMATDHPVIQKYSSEGNLLYEKHWSSNSIHTLADTSAIPFSTITYHYKNGILTGTLSCVAIDDELKCLPQRMVTMEQSGSKTTCLFRSPNYSDSIDFTIVTVLDTTLHKPLFSYQIFKEDTTWIKTWRYDSMGRVTYYSCWESALLTGGHPLLLSVFIRRDEKGLPVLVQQSTNSDRVTFKLTWQ